MRQKQNSVLMYTCKAGIVSRGWGLRHRPENGKLCVLRQKKYLM